MVAAHAPADGEALLDWNESPIGPPTLAVKRVIDTAGRLHRYPRGLMEEVTELAAAHVGVAPDRILLTAGVDEAVDIALSLVERGWGTRPGFDGYEDRVLANGKRFHPIALGPDWQPASPPDPGLGEGDMVFLAQPGNPTGNLLPVAWIDAVRAKAQYVFIDETYHEFSTRPSVLRVARDESPGGAADKGLLVYRSFSKAAGLAGIRLGCLIGESTVIERLEPVRRFMPIDAVSLNAAAGLLEEPEFMVRLTAHVLEARTALCETLRASGLFEEVRETETNFVLAKPWEWASAPMSRQFERDLVRVKDCAAVSLPGWLRISVGSWDDQARLGASLGRVAK